MCVIKMYQFYIQMANSLDMKNLVDIPTALASLHHRTTHLHKSPDWPEMAHRLVPSVSATPRERARSPHSTALSRAPPDRPRAARAGHCGARDRWEALRQPLSGARGKRAGHRRDTYRPDAELEGGQAGGRCGRRRMKVSVW